MQAIFHKNRFVEKIFKKDTLVYNLTLFGAESKKLILHRTTSRGNLLIQNSYFKKFMIPQYRPNVEIAKLRYSAMLRERLRQQRKGKSSKETPHIRDNSEPWIKGPITSLREIIEISDKIKAEEEKWTKQNTEP